MRRLALVLLSAGVAGWLAGCGASAAPSPVSAATSVSNAQPGTAAVTTATKRPADPVKSGPRLVRVAPTAYGMALTDRRGFALYRFTHDTRPASTCYGACARAWPPYLVPRKQASGATDGGLLGTARRTDGRLQVTYAGHPLYYYVGDRRPGQVLCQGVTEYGGGWYVVAPSGHLIR
jgi:predicted lipoprotein with Yx(FWY)xxD motif